MYKPLLYKRDGAWWSQWTDRIVGRLEGTKRGDLPAAVDAAMQMSVAGTIGGGSWQM